MTTAAVLAAVQQSDSWQDVVELFMGLAFCALLLWLLMRYW